jgi:hypothetical protein
LEPEVFKERTKLRRLLFRQRVSVRIHLSHRLTQMKHSSRACCISWRDIVIHLC